MKRVTAVTRIVRYKTSVTAEDICKFVGAPLKSRVYVQIPGGSDWGGEPLEVSESEPVFVEWEEKSETQQ